MPTSVAVIGAGYIAKFHFDGFAEAGARVAVIADVERKVAEPYLARFGADFTTDWRAAIARKDVDLVCVCTPSGLHFEQSKFALEQGKHVVCEKTLTLTPAESLTLGRLAEQRGLLFWTCYMKRYFPATQKAKELIPQLGHLTSVYCRTYQPVGHDFHTQKPFGGFLPGPDGKSSVVRKYGGGVLVCGGSHIFDLLCFLTGKPSRIYGKRFQHTGTDADMMFHCLLEYDAGTVAHFEANWHPLNRIARGAGVASGGMPPIQLPPSNDYRDPVAALHEARPPVPTRVIAGDSVRPSK